MVALYVGELAMFIIAAIKDFHMTSLQPSAGGAISTTYGNGVNFVHGQREWPIYWLRALVMLVPAVCGLIIVLTGLQSKQHLAEIRQDCAQHQHDRVINILILPAFYATVVMSGLTRVYTLAVDEMVHELDHQRWPDWGKQQALGLARYETCVFVGDLYEAWALYQFAMLTVDLLKEALPEKPKEDATHLSFQAVSSVMWLGTGLFIAVNFVQSGWALYMWYFQSPGADWNMFQFALSRFSYAGMVASAAAIYNVHIVESTFGHFIKGYSPFTKFLSVKILVFFAFWQGPCLSFLQSIRVLNMTGVQLKLFQATLLVFECLAATILHFFAWRPQEQWFAGVDEKTPLLDTPVDTAGFSLLQNAQSRMC